MVKKYVEREIISREFPKDLEERLEAILSSVNTEYKSVTLGFLLDDSWKTSNDIRNAAESYINPVTNIIPSDTSFKAYCTFTFIPIGAVAEERIKGRIPVSYYKLTEDGEKYGKPIAQFSLRTAVDYKLSMYEIFGSTPSPGKTRSPFNTAKILFELEKEDNLRRVDLVNECGLTDSIVKQHLLRLKNIGFVNYDSVSGEESGWSKYEWIKGKNLENIKPVCKLPTLTKKVANKMKKLEISDCNELAEVLDYKHPEDISKILSGLEKQGFVKKVKFKGREFKFGEKQSEASITEKGRKFVYEFLELVCQALGEDDFDGIYQEIEIFDDPSITSDYISRGFSLYKEVCPVYKRKSKKDNESRILQILKNQKLRRKEINEALGKDVTIYLRELIKRGEIKKEREGSAVYYSLA